MATKGQMLQEARDEKERMKAEKAYNQSLTNTEFAPKFGPTNEERYLEQRRADRADMAKAARDQGRQEGYNRQQKAATRGGVLGTPAAYLERAGQYIGDKFDDADAFLSEKMGMTDRANFKKGVRQGLKDEGYKKGGNVSSASKRADGIATKGKTRGTIITMKGGGSAC